MKSVARDFGTSQPPLSPTLLQTCGSSSWVATAVAAGDPHSVPSGSAFATALIIWTNTALVYNHVNLEQPLCHFSSANIALCLIPISSFTQMEPGRRGRKAALSEYPCIDLFWMQAPGDRPGRTLDLCRYGSCCWPFFSPPLV